MGSTPLRVRTVFFKAVMFPLHLISPSRVSFPLPPALIRSSQSTRDIIRLGPAPPYCAASAASAAVAGASSLMGFGKKPT